MHRPLDSRTQHAHTNRLLPSRVDTSALYARYKAEQQHQTSLRTVALKTAREQRRPKPPETGSDQDARKRTPHEKIAVCANPSNATRRNRHSTRALSTRTRRDFIAIPTVCLAGVAATTSQGGRQRGTVSAASQSDSASAQRKYRHGPQSPY
jgi:hypothetical protein